MNKLFFFFLLFVCVLFSCSSDNEEETLYGTDFAKVFETVDMEHSVTYGDSLVIKSRVPFMVHSLYRIIDGKKEPYFKQFIMTRGGVVPFEPQAGNHYWLGLEHPTDCTLVVKIAKEALGDTVHTIYLQSSMLPNSEGWQQTDDVIRFNLCNK